MRALRILIVYGSNYGQTARIASHIRERLAGLGFETTLIKGDTIPPAPDLDAYDGVIVGASLIMQRHQRYIERFVRTYRAALDRRPAAFFSVSGSAASPFAEGRAAARHALEAFLVKTGWHPPQTATFGGAMAYTKYDPVTRWVLRLIARRNRASTDTSRDHEYTDWGEVERFAQMFATLVRQHEPAALSTVDA